MMIKINFVVISISMLLAISDLSGSIITEEPVVAKVEEALTKETISDISTNVMNHLVQPTDESYRVLSYSNKDELVESFSPYTSLSLAKKMVDLYYREHDNQLFIVPTETPAWFVESNDYSVDAVTDNHKVVTQTNTSDLYGTYTIHMDFVYKQSQGWILHDVTYEY